MTRKLEAFDLNVNPQGIKDAMAYTGSDPVKLAMKQNASELRDIALASINAVENAPETLPSHVVMDAKLRLQAAALKRALK